MKPRPGISANGLKWIAILAMFVDHTGEAYIDRLPVPLYFIMRVIGRCTMPIMCFLLAQGFQYTRDKKKYALRLLIFALASQLPYNFFGSGNPLRVNFGPGCFNVLFTLLLGLCALWALQSEWKPPAKIAAAALCVLASILSDWPMFGVLFILAFGLHFVTHPGPSYKRQAKWYSLAAAVFILSNVIFVHVNGEPMYIAPVRTRPVLPAAAAGDVQRQEIRREGPRLDSQQMAVLRDIPASPGGAGFPAIRDLKYCNAGGDVV